MALHDNEAKTRLGYKDPRTKVYPDGREVLFGADWKRRKLELWVRCAHRCEQWVESHPDIRVSLSCTVRCHNDAHDPHHIIPRSKGRDDRLSNLVALCRLHHELLDWKKLNWRKDAPSPGPSVSP